MSGASNLSEEAPRGLRSSASNDGAREEGCRLHQVPHLRRRERGAHPARRLGRGDRPGILGCQVGLGEHDHGERPAPRRVQQLVTDLRRPQRRLARRLRLGHPQGHR